MNLNVIMGAFYPRDRTSLLYLHISKSHKNHRSWVSLLGSLAMWTLRTPWTRTAPENRCRAVDTTSTHLLFVLLNRCCVVLWCRERTRLHALLLSSQGTARQCHSHNSLWPSQETHEDTAWSKSSIDTERGCSRFLEEILFPWT